MHAWSVYFYLSRGNYATNQGENMDKLLGFEGENMDKVLVNFRLSLCKDEKCYSTSKR